MIIGYSKLGRSWNLDPSKASTVGGDMDVVRLLKRLAWDHPEHTFLLVGRNSGEDPARLGYPSNVVNPWQQWRMKPVPWDDLQKHPQKFVDDFLSHWRSISSEVDLDRHVMWLGQHGTSNSCIPNIGSDWDDVDARTTPQASMLNYCSYILELCRRTFVKPILLCPDPRNYIKARELKHGPQGDVLAQFNMVRQAKLEQFQGWSEDGMRPGFEPHPPGHREGSVWVTQMKYVYSGLELTALDEPSNIVCNRVVPGEHMVGLISNENRKNVGRYSRLPLVKDWLLSWAPGCPMYGAWTDESQEALGRRIESIPQSSMYDVLRTFRMTITFPASGSGWATAKPWEAFAAGCVMFFHPGYDVQGHILPLRGAHHWSSLYPEIASAVTFLSDFLRVRDVHDLRNKAGSVAVDDALWSKIVRAQRSYFEIAFMHWRGGARMVEEAL